MLTIYIDVMVLKMKRRLFLKFSLSASLLLMLKIKTESDIHAVEQDYISINGWVIPIKDIL